MIVRLMIRSGQDRQCSHDKPTEMNISLGHMVYNGHDLSKGIVIARIRLELVFFCLLFSYARAGRDLGSEEFILWCDLLITNVFRPPGDQLHTHVVVTCPLLTNLAVKRLIDDMFPHPIGYASRTGTLRDYTFTRNSSAKLFHHDAQRYRFDLVFVIDSLKYNYQNKLWVVSLCDIPPSLTSLSFHHQLPTRAGPESIQTKKKEKKPTHPLVRCGGLCPLTKARAWRWAWLRPHPKV